MRQQKEEIIAIYPKTETGFVGDPMSYFDGENFQIYYLEDLRDGQIGFHPFSLIKTNDFYHYENIGEVLPFVNEVDSPERALGTGSVIRDERGLYHAFYTGHNDELTPKEIILHATSKDGEKWQKFPEEGFFASNNYEKNDFRDPYVFWNDEKQQYWMLITTRANGIGVIAKYTSADLTNWQDEGIFFQNDLGNDANLECPSLVYFEGKWILAFSDQWNQRVVHYRWAESSQGPFEKSVDLGQDALDGAGFYAGRLVSDADHLYVVGWIPTKEQHDDRFGYNWAGNLAVHELQLSNENVKVALPTSINTKNFVEKLPELTLSEGESYTFDEVSQVVIQGNIELKDENSKIILELSDGNTILLDFAAQSMSYYNTSVDHFEKSRPLSQNSLNINGKVPLKIVKEEAIVVVYCGDKALSNRIYKSKNQPITLKVIQGSVTFSGEL